MEDYINPNSIDGDDLLEGIEEDVNNSDSFPNNDFFFTEEDFIESLHNINDTARHRGNYNCTWNKLKPRR